ncbi:MAG: hypothetical protein QNK37_12635 [Acidobacteriota bacterium]|nr:hypothetical protein [Acidobacteriota bacterium]
MSDLRIALIAEGVTDQIVIEAALKAILKDKTFVLTLLQPEETDALGGHSRTGGGWGGVYRWCLQRQAMSPTPCAVSMLQGFDLVIFHLDADVARARYSEAGITDRPIDDLPCELPCPPALDTVYALRKVIIDWPGMRTVTRPPVYCIPSQSTETWMAAAMFPQERTPNLECREDLLLRLAQCPREIRLIRFKQGKPKKQKRRFEEHATTLTRYWEAVKATCTTADLFEEDVTLALE